MPRLRIGHGNFAAGNKRKDHAVRFAVALNCDSFGYNEGRLYQGRIKRLAGRYRNHTAKGGEYARAYDDVGVLVRNNRTGLGEFHMKISDEVPRFLRVAPNRWLSVAMYRHDEFGRIAHVSIHPDAGPRALRGTDETHPLAREYGNAVDSLDRVLGFLDSLNFRIVVTGDIQVPESAPERPWSIYPVLEKHGLDWTTVHIDLIAWPAKHMRLARRKVIPQSATGSDHRWIVATLKRSRWWKRRLRKRRN